MLANSLNELWNVQTILLILFGNLLGTIVGSIPGLGGAVLLVMLLPFLYNMPVIPALALLLAAHTGIYYSGSITAILLNTPGAPESAATTFDGYAMTQKGKGTRALGISAASTTIGGWIGVILLIFMIPLMYHLVTLFQPSEYFLLAILAIVLIGQLRSASMTKGLLSGLFGLMVSFVGYDPITGVQRFSFNWLSLYNGFNITAVAMGLFAMGEMFVLYEKAGGVMGDKPVDLSSQPGNKVMDGVKDALGHWWLLIRSAVIGTFLGLVPGIGGLAANFISYGQAMKSSKHPELFGTGIPEGIVAPEGSSISKEAGSLVPTCSLGIPGGVGMAVLMSAFTILGIVPGPPMLISHLDLVYAMALVIGIGSLLSSLTGLGMAPTLAKVSQVPGPILVPFIYVLAYLGVFAASTDVNQIIFLFFFGLVGLLARRYKYSMPAIIIGYILGTVAERNLYLSVQLQGMKMFERPLTDILILVILIMLVGPSVTKRLRRRGVKEDARTGSCVTAAAMPVVRLEFFLDIAWVLFAALYLWMARGYPAAGREIPDVVGTGTLIVGLVQLAGNFIPALRLLTHGQERDERSRRPGKPDTGPEDGSPAHRGLKHTERQQLAAVGWAAALLLGIFVLGYEIAVPVFFLVYFSVKRHRDWKKAVIAAAVMWLLTWGLFEHVLSVHLTGSIFL